MENYFLIEFYFEKLDIDFREHLKNKISNVFNSFLNLNNLNKDNFSIKFYLLAQRIIFLIELKDSQATYTYKGVKTVDTKENLNYFLAKHNILDSDKIYIKNNRYYYDTTISCVEIIDKIKNNLENILINIFSMVKIKNSASSLLKLKNIFYLANGEKSCTAFNNKIASNIIIIKNKTYIINNKDEYFQVLQANNIFIDQNDYKNYIKNYFNVKNYDISEVNLNNFVKNIIIKYEVIDIQLEKIIYNCNEKYLQILQQFLKNEYLFFIDKNNLCFIYCSNYDKSNSLYHIKKIEKSIVKLNEIIKNYENEILTQNKIKNNYFNREKCIVIEQIIKYISIWIPYFDLSKLKLISEYLFLFNKTNFKNKNLELLIKKYIISTNSKYNNVADILINIFDCSSGTLSVAINLSNRLYDITQININKIFKQNYNKDTEKELYYEIINIIIVNKIKLPLRLVFGFIFKHFINLNLKIKQNKKIIKKENIDVDYLINKILEDFYNRLYLYLQINDKYNKNILSNIINNKINNIKKHNCNLFEEYNYIRFVHIIFTKYNSLHLISLYRRLNKLLAENTKREKIFIKNFNFISKKVLFGNELDNELHTNIYAIYKEIRHKNLNYYNIINRINILKNILEKYLNNIFIKKSNFFLKKKRIRLLLKTKMLFNKILNFNNIKI